MLTSKIIAPLDSGRVLVRSPRLLIDARFMLVKRCLQVRVVCRLVFQGVIVMARDAINAATLEGYLNDALYKATACEGIRTGPILRVDGRKSNWDCALQTDPAVEIPSDCERTFNAAKNELRLLYDLLTD